jgi:hypothetical protein
MVRGSLVKQVNWRTYRFLLICHFGYHYKAYEGEYLIDTHNLGVDTTEAHKDFNAYVTEFICEKLKDPSVSKEDVANS